MVRGHINFLFNTQNILQPKRQKLRLALKGIKQIESLFSFLPLLNFALQKINLDSESSIPDNNVIKCPVLSPNPHTLIHKSISGFNYVLENFLLLTKNHRRPNQFSIQILDFC